MEYSYQTKYSTVVWGLIGENSLHFCHPLRQCNLLLEAGRRRTSFDTGSRHAGNSASHGLCQCRGSLESGICGLPCSWPPCFESPPTHQPVYSALGYKPIISLISFLSNHSKHQQINCMCQFGAQTIFVCPGPSFSTYFGFDSIC